MSRRGLFLQNGHNAGFLLQEENQRRGIEARLNEFCAHIGGGADIHTITGHAEQGVNDLGLEADLLIEICHAHESHALLQDTAFVGDEEIPYGFKILGGGITQNASKDIGQGSGGVGKVRTSGALGGQKSLVVIQQFGENSH